MTSAAAQILVAVTTSLRERQPRTLKHGDTFAVFDQNGDAIGAPGNSEGIYHCDTRHLSHLLVTIDGLRPILLNSTLRDDNAVLLCDLTNPELARPDETIAQDLLHIRRTRFLWNGRVFERLALRNFDIRPREFRLRIDFEADFADIFEVRGTPRSAHGERHSPRIEPDAATLSYTGRDARLRETRLQFEPTPTEIGAGFARFDLTLAPIERMTLYLEIRCGVDYGPHSPRRSFFSCYRAARHALRVSASRAASIASSNELFNETVRRAISDLYMLTTETPLGPYPYAGVPWFSTYFGRDALITAYQTLWLDPAIARGVLRQLAANQATESDASRDAEPGKILHEMRFGEMAALREVPFGCYYGSVDATRSS